MVVLGFFTRLTYIKDFHTLDHDFLGNCLCVATFANHANATMCIHVWKMSRHWEIFNQLFWPNGTRSRLASISQCKWMLLQLVHKHIDSTSCGLKPNTTKGDLVNILVHIGHIGHPHVWWMAYWIQDAIHVGFVVMTTFGYAQ